MRNNIVVLAALSLGLSLAANGHVAAQTSGTNLGTPQTQPMPGGGVDRGPGAPTSALSDRVDPGLGAPAPGSATPSATGDATSGSNVAPSGAIRPGSKPGGDGTGGNSSASGG
jgi:hypothetical protein